jgi:hypothetical protein
MRMREWNRQWSGRAVLACYRMVDRAEAYVLLRDITRCQQTIEWNERRLAYLRALHVERRARERTK